MKKKYGSYYRCKQYSVNKWVEGFLTTNVTWDETDGVNIAPLYKNDFMIFSYKDNNQYYDLDMGTLCKYIGKKDNNGIKIFTGDIVTHYESGEPIDYIVYWDEVKLQYRFKAIYCDEDYDWDDANIDVVAGNIYDNFSNNLIDDLNYINDKNKKAIKYEQKIQEKNLLNIAEIEKKIKDKELNLHNVRELMDDANNAGDQTSAMFAGWSIENEIKELKETLTTLKEIN